MKKLTLTLAALTMIFASCKKEENTPQPVANTVSTSCNCGLIVSDEVSDYSITIRNSCSGNTKKFRLTEGDWMNAHVGTNYCITNTTNW